MSVELKVCLSSPSICGRSSLDGLKRHHNHIRFLVIVIAIAKEISQILLSKDRRCHRVGKRSDRARHAQKPVVDMNHMRQIEIASVASHRRRHEIDDMFIPLIHSTWSVHTPRCRPTAYCPPAGRTSARDLAPCGGLVRESIHLAVTSAIVLRTDAESGNPQARLDRLV